MFDLLFSNVFMAIQNTAQEYIDGVLPNFSLFMVACVAYAIRKQVIAC